MTKKEKKADTILKEALEYVKKVSVSKVKPSERIVPPTPTLKKVVERKEVEPMVFKEGMKFYDFHITKLEKGSFRVRAVGKSGEFIKHCKSRTKAEEWCERHRL